MLVAGFTGCIAGFIHVLSGPDHLATMAPIALNARWHSWWLGTQWGFGHTGGVWLIGVLALLLRDLLPLEWLSSWSERLVGVALIGLGVWALRRALTMHIHVHTHQHDGSAHPHRHVHAHRAGHAVDQPQAHRHSHTAMAFGVLHGLAGSSHFLGVLPSLALPRNEAIAYLLAFGIGSILSMALFAGALGWATNRFEAGARLLRGLQCSAASVAILVGCLWLF